MKPELPLAGSLLVFEGPDGCGKSSQMDTLATVLRSQGRDVLTLREPGSTPLAVEIRAILKHATYAITPRAEAHLLLACRADLWTTEIRPALHDGKTILLDRSSPSTLAFQGAGRGLPLAELFEGCRVAQCGLVPDATFLFHAPDAVLDARLAARGDNLDRFEADAPLRNRVREFYAALTEQATGLYGSILPFHALTGPIYAIDANAEYSAVAARVRRASEAALSPAGPTPIPVSSIVAGVA